MQDTGDKDFRKKQTEVFVPDILIPAN